MKIRQAMLVGFACIVAASTTACAPSRGDAFLLASAQARRAESAGRFAEAAHSYDEASRTAKLPRDRNFAAYMAATMTDRAGDPVEAERRLRVLAKLDPPSEYSPVAGYLAAVYRYKAGDAATGHRELEEVSKKFPENGAAKSALRRLIQEADEEGSPAKTMAAIDRWLPSFRGTELEQLLTYERTKRLEATGDREGALTALLALADRFPYPKGAYRDDALFHASELEEALGRPQRAVAHLETLLKDREKSSLMGTYERPKFSKAMKRLADLYEFVLRDRPRAREALHRLYADFPSSLDRDDALYREAALWESDGNKGTACDRLDTLVSTFPNSRYVPCATLKCAAIKRPEKSKAPAECRGYLTRTMNGEKPDKENEAQP